MAPRSYAALFRMERLVDMRLPLLGPIRKFPNGMSGDPKRRADRPARPALVLRGEAIGLVELEWL